MTDITKRAKVLIWTAAVVIALASSVAVLANQPPPECGCPCYAHAPLWYCYYACGPDSYPCFHYSGSLGGYLCTEPCPFGPRKNASLLENIRKAGCKTRAVLAFMKIPLTPPTRGRIHP